MIAFLSMLQEKYGGVENYLKQYTELSEEDLEKIRTNLLISTHNI
jgi:CRISPR/Cas system type I-B associated protein Csh2 (Cas7 group RAMP superfamily)